MIQHIVHNCITLLWFSSKKYSKIQSKSQMSCSDAKESACNTGDGVNPWVGKIPWNREWQSTPVFLPGESHGQRRLAGYSPWGHWTQLSNTFTFQAHLGNHTLKISGPARTILWLKCYLSVSLIILVE